MTQPDDQATAIKQALARSVQDSADAGLHADVRKALRQRLHREQRPDTLIYIGAQVILLAILLAAGLWYWLY